MDEDALRRCEDLLDYSFHDRTHLRLALTHASVSPTRQESNERLEFLGDAVLGLVICSYLYREHETLMEGDMTKIKSSVVSRQTCAEVVHEIGLCSHLALGGDLGDLPNLPQSVAAAVLESMIGAIYVDGGYEPAERFILRVMGGHLEAALDNSHGQNYKSLLQQYAQRDVATSPEYLLLDEQGPDHSKCFEVAVSLDGRTFTSAWGRSKKEAEQAAAQRALIELGLLKEDSAMESADTD